MAISALWWAFAVGDDDGGLRALEAASAELRTRLAFSPYSPEHLLHIAGLILVAVGSHEVVHDPVHHLDWDVATTLSAGATVFLLAQALFRSTLGAGSVRVHVAAAVLVLVVTPVGVLVSGVVQPACVVIVLVGATAVRQRLTSDERIAA